jgi:DNA-binding LacI/PurR family transcriptional regulator
MEDVARQARVSRALVSLVMRDSPQVSPDKRHAVREAARQLGYTPNRLASRLASRRTSTLGVLLLDLHNPVFAQIYDGIAEGVQGSGKHLMVALGSTDAVSEALAIQSLLDLRVDGMLLAGYTGGPEELRHILQGTPAVVITREVDIAGVDSASASDYRGAQLAVEHLVQLGHTRILHIAQPPGLNTSWRQQGYTHAMRSHGLHPVVVTAPMTEQGGYQAMVDYLDSAAEEPTAIFTHNDMVAVGVLDALGSRGLPVPGAVSVVGYDNTELAATQLVGLTSIDLHARELGRLAASAMLSRLDSGEEREPQRIRIDPVLVVRKTTARASSVTMS